MDRFDERKDRVEDVEETRAQPREGDVLGLGGVDVPKAPDDPSTEYDPQSVAQRRARANADQKPASEPVDPSNQGGATGIDMGAGGQGTLVRRE